MPAGRKLNFHAIDAHIGARLRQRHTELGISQKRLAEVAGVNYQQIHKYESAVDRIPAGRLYRLARFLNIPVAYFLGSPDDLLKIVR